MKHFSPRPVEQWEDPVPKASRRRRSDAASRAFRAIPRESSGSGGNAAAAAMRRAGAAGNDADLDLAVVAPAYWKNQDLAINFDDKVRLRGDAVAKFQELVDATFIRKATRDRQGGQLPERLRVTDVMRIEDRDLWNRFLRKRAELASGPRPTMIKDLPGNGEVKTRTVGDPQDGPLHITAPALNEAYFFHGTSPAGAMGIGESGFNLGMVGSNVGTMFGAGAYMAEASSKSDEYASEDLSGVFAGKYAFLLCRVLVGNAFYTRESDIPAIEAAIATGNYQAVLGDREAAVGTYREFVVFDEAQVYPEYIIVYERKYSY